MNNQDYKELAKNIRKDVLKLTYEKKAGFIGASFSCADILAVMFGGYVDVEGIKQEKEDRDLVILSKGHAASALYAALANVGLLEKDKMFDEFHTSGYSLGVHPKRNTVPGIETSTGSLGQGLGLGCGAALAMKIQNQKSKVFVIVGDGEINEGSVWESLMFAKKNKLNNLVLIVDRNKLQSYGHDEDVLNLEEVAPKIKTFGWNTIEVDGHSVEELDEAFKCAMSSDMPTAIVANTVKGKGCRDFEDKVLWHYKWPETEHYEKGLKELEENA